MKKYFWSLILIILCSTSLGFCFQTQAEQPEHLAVLFLIDDSGSMFGNDQTNLRYSAAAMFISALDAGDWVGLVQFADSAHAVTPQMVQIKDANHKKSLLDMLTAPTADGYTNVLDAFFKGKQVLTNLPSGNIKPVVILLTDGKPEVYQMPADYISQALAAGLGLDIPIYSVSLTSEGQSQFLTDLTTATGGKIFKAQTSLDLLDRYLSILTELKDRSVIGEGIQSSPKEIEIKLDPALQPYINQFTVIASVNGQVHSHLVSPNGKTVAYDDPDVSFIVNSDGRFQVYSIRTPVVGSWKLILEGAGQAQVRTILHTRLRAKFDGLKSLIPQAEPMLISVNVEELLESGERQKIIGDVNFDGVVHLPDGSAVSLDRFYDDGTHGDPFAEDGNYSRVLVGTNQIGVYQIDIHGYKSGIPVEIHDQVEILPFPKFNLIEPAETKIFTKREAVSVVFESTGAQNEFLEGELHFLVTDPLGKTSSYPFDRNETQFQGWFVPSESGIHQITLDTKALVYLGQPVISMESKILDIQLIAEVSKIKDGFANDREIFTVSEFTQGIDYWMTVISNSTQTEKVTFQLVGIAGAYLSGETEFILPPQQETTINLKIQTLTENKTGIYSGEIRMISNETINSQSFVVPIEWEVILPALSWRVEEHLFEPSGACWVCPDAALVLQTNLSHFQPVALDYQVVNADGEVLLSDVVDVMPGDQEYRIPFPQGCLDKGSFYGMILISTTNQSIELSQKEQPLVFEVSPVLIRCKTPLIISGCGLCLTAMIGMKLIGKRRQKNKPPLVRLDVFYWPLANPLMEIQHSFAKESVRIGSGETNDLILTGVSVLEEHALITAAANELDEIEYYLEPIGGIQKGYSIIKRKILLEEQTVYQIGEWGIKFIFDPTVN